ncbi:MAG: helix-turn-helix domain-containing protein [Prevotella sp.]|nr:helix-turn-helix domain-containing protein [Prevotella sp.]
MGKIENDELRKLKNANFMKAFKYVADKLKMNQGQLAKAIGSKSAYISNFSSGIRPVPEETIDALVAISAQIPNGQIFTEYLHGNSSIMLLANVTDEEMTEAKRRATNPDYDAMQARLKEKEKQLDNAITQSLPFIDPASQQNASIAAYVQLTNRLTDDLKKKEIEMTERLAEKDIRIAELKDTVAAKEEIIKSRDAHIIELERKLAAATTDDLTRYPFTMGAAEERNK